ncbi:MAG: hypothetical protein MSH48_00965 [Mollicutes bacterium]|nr:hypothetical protein [Mollicutes bacterium]
MEVTSSMKKADLVDALNK